MRLRRSDMTWQQLDDEIVVLDLAGRVYLSLNGTGALLWKELADGSDRDRLVATLTERFQVEPEQAGEDVDAFVAQLEQADLLER